MVLNLENAHYQPLTASIAKMGLLVKNGSVHAFKTRLLFLISD
jgi:hypothetical protein